MKTSLLLFCTVFIIETFVFAEDDNKRPQLVIEAFPEPKKKGISMYHNGLKYLNRRYAKSTDSPKTKKHVENVGYTVFPVHLARSEQNKDVDVPSSPYFPLEPQDEPKLRVKKVLPDFYNISRRKKRSPDDQANSNSSPAKTSSAVTLAEKDVATKAKSEAPQKNSKVAQKDGKNEEDSTKKVVNAPIAKTLKTKPVGKTGNSRRSAGESNKKTVRGLPRSKNSHPSSNRKEKNKARRSKDGARSNKKGSKKSLKHSQRKNGPKRGKERASRRLIAARDAMIENYPYVASIQKDGEHWCAGALLNQRLVITTANCVWKSSRMTRMKVRVGSRYVDHGGQVFHISEVMKHPEWSIRKNPDNDVALLLTDGFVKFSHACHAVDLPNRVMMPIFDDAWVVSWGADRRDGVYVKQGLTLQVVHARLESREKCNNVTMRFGVQVTENFICLEQTGRRAPCTRDTGAPAVSDGVLWGLASWGIRKLCGTERFPAMYSYIASHSNMDFILNATHFLMAEQRLNPFLDRYHFRSTKLNATKSKS